MFCVFILLLVLAGIRQKPDLALPFVLVLTILPLATIKLYRHIEEEAHDLLSGWKVVAALLFGSLLTYFLVTSMSINVVLAASAVGTCGVYVPGLLRIKDSKDYVAPIYCGAFIGMSSALIFPNVSWLLFSSVLSALLFIISKNIYLGVGGKLGAIAFMGVSITLLVGKLL
jgi:hypothetical protein